MKLALAILLATCLTFVYADRHLTITQSSYYGCYETYLYNCTTCYNGIGSNWYYIYEMNGVYYQTNGTSSSVCYPSGGVPLQKSSNCPVHNYCSATYDVSYRYDALAVSTMAPALRVSTILQTDDYDYTDVGEITYSSVELYSTVLKQLLFKDHNGDKLHFIKKLSNTEFLTNFGVYPIGLENQSGNFTFTYKSFESDTEPSNPPFTPSLPTSGTLVYLYPFPSIEVTDSSKKVAFAFDEFAVGFYGQNAQTDFQGIDLYNPFFGMKDLGFYPPYYESSDDGTMIFTLIEGNDYRAIPCEYDQSGSFEFYEAEFSFSLDLSDHLSIFFSLSLDEFGYPKQHSSADDMAFNLF